MVNVFWGYHSAFQLLGYVISKHYTVREPEDQKAKQQYCVNLRSCTKSDISEVHPVTYHEGTDKELEVQLPRPFLTSVLA